MWPCCSLLTRTTSGRFWASATLPLPDYGRVARDSGAIPRGVSDQLRTRPLLLGGDYASKVNACRASKTQFLNGVRPDYAGHPVFLSHDPVTRQVALILRTGGPAAIDLRVRQTYDLSTWPRPLNPSGRRFPITAYFTKSAVGGWVSCTKRKTSSSVARSP